MMHLRIFMKHIEQNGQGRNYQNILTHILSETLRIVYIGAKDSVQKLKRRILLERFRFIPGTKILLLKM